MLNWSTLRHGTATLSKTPQEQPNTSVRELQVHNRLYGWIDSRSLLLNSRS